MSTIAAVLPDSNKVVAMMQGLFGLPVKTCEAADQPSEEYVYAQYVDDTDQPVAWISCDLSSACRLGAALTQIPAGRVHEAIADGILPENLRENLDEIFNICVNLISDGRRLVMRRTSQQDEESFEEIRVASTAGAQTEFAFHLERYGECRLTVGL